MGSGRKSRSMGTGTQRNLDKKRQVFTEKMMTRPNGLNLHKRLVSGVERFLVIWVRKFHKPILKQIDQRYAERTETKP